MEDRTVKNRDILDSAMNQQITLEVSEKVMRQAAMLASYKKRRVEDVLSDLLESAVSETSVEQMSDSDVLALTKLFMSAEQQELLSDLLFKKRERVITTEEHKQLDELMKVYEQCLLQKAEAFRVAVQRGLIPALSE
jgi:hypothetical protein